MIPIATIQLLTTEKRNFKLIEMFYQRFKFDTNVIFYNKLTNVNVFI